MLPSVREDVVLGFCREVQFKSRLALAFLITFLRGSPPAPCYLPDTIVQRLGDLRFAWVTSSNWGSHVWRLPVAETSVQCCGLWPGKVSWDGGEEGASALRFWTALLRGWNLHFLPISHT